MLDEKDLTQKLTKINMYSQFFNHECCTNVKVVWINYLLIPVPNFVSTVHLDLQCEKNGKKGFHQSFSFFFIVLCFYTSGLSIRKLICFLTALFDFSSRHIKPLHLGSGVKKLWFFMNLKC